MLIFSQQSEQFEQVVLDTIELHQLTQEPDLGLFQELEVLSSFFLQSKLFEQVVVDTIVLQQQTLALDQ